ncbi:hypothetical protein BDD12DRAFT_842344 [Trichophaea hybrida]|nr:hypothetical protein BDD12DRAFT_842344 [Trichophaea hybrida]
MIGPWRIVGFLFFEFYLLRNLGLCWLVFFFLHLCLFIASCTYIEARGLLSAHRRVTQRHRVVSSAGLEVPVAVV